jgi:hypothetical protein
MPTNRLKFTVALPPRSVAETRPAAVARFGEERMIVTWNVPDQAPTPSLSLCTVNANK